MTFTAILFTCYAAIACTPDTGHILGTKQLAASSRPVAERRAEEWASRYMGNHALRHTGDRYHLIVQPAAGTIDDEAGDDD